MAKHYCWPPDFWRKMGKREFYAWVDEVHRDTFGPAPSPHRWVQNSEEDDWFERARERRDKQMGR